MDKQAAAAWQLYEAGKEYKRRIGLYERVRQNEAFYRGEQWQNGENDLPRPVFNLVRRITDFWVSATLPGDLSIHYRDEGRPFLQDPDKIALLDQSLDALERNTAYRWKRDHLQSIAYRALLNAALTGDGIFYCRWDAHECDGQELTGDICTDVLNNTDFFVSDVNSTDLQSQEYILLSGRASVDALRREAMAAGMSAKEAGEIVGDEDDCLPRAELQTGGKATYLLRFFREKGEVICEKSTRQKLVRRVHTGLRLYPVTYFNWCRNKDSFHGTAPVSDMIANQKYINTAYSMVMKHMYDTAFSKVVYDKSRIPEWSNEVGEAIAAVGGGTVSDAVSVIGVGKLQNGYLDLIENVIQTTKDLMGATEAALGDAPAHNTSALLLLQQASGLALGNVRIELSRAVSELAMIWADMICTYYPRRRLLLTESEDGLAACTADTELLRAGLLTAAVEVGQTDNYTPAATVNLLNKLLDAGYLAADDYIRLLPPGSVGERDRILQCLQPKGVRKDG